MNKVRVRFAPSPTGKLHLGGARTALFNYLFARKYKGNFLLRIEDTDIKRSKNEYTKQIIESLSWLGLKYDEKPLYQSKRFDRYNQVIQDLLLSGNAYKCFCSKEELENSKKKSSDFSYSKKCRDRSISIERKNKPYTIRIKVPPEPPIEFTDEIYSNISVDGNEIDDFIIARTDGSPTYNLVVVVDDFDMNISHVIRGEDHISNTSKQIVIYNLLNWRQPKFAHLPMILGQDKKRLSKRHGSMGLDSYKKLGYYPDSMINYLTLLGWNPGTDQEIYNITDLINDFSLEKINKSAAVFDLKKLNWINGQHLAKKSPEFIFDSIINIHPDWGSKKSKDFCYKVIRQLSPRSDSLIDVVNQSDYFFNNTLDYNNELKNKVWKEGTFNILKHYNHSISNIAYWNSNNLEAHLKKVVSDLEVGFGKVMQPVRFLITGKINGPSLFEVMVIIGKKVCLKRLESHSSFKFNDKIL